MLHQCEDLSSDLQHPLKNKPGLVVYTYNPSAGRQRKDDSEGSLVSQSSQLMIPRFS